MAIEANRSAQSLCKDDQEGIKDLEQQHQKFTTEHAPTHFRGVFTAFMSCSQQHLESHLLFFPLFIHLEQQMCLEISL